MKKLLQARFEKHDNLFNGFTLIYDELTIDFNKKKIIKSFGSVNSNAGTLLFNGVVYYDLKHFQSFYSRFYFNKVVNQIEDYLTEKTMIGLNNVDFKDLIKQFKDYELFSQKQFDYYIVVNKMRVMIEKRISDEKLAMFFSELFLSL
jgi:hypothetical protein